MGLQQHSAVTKAANTVRILWEQNLQGAAIKKTPLRKVRYCRRTWFWTFVSNFQALSLN